MVGATEEVVEVGRVVRTRRRRSWGSAFANASGERGVRAETENRAAVAWFRVPLQKHMEGVVEGIGRVWGMRWWW
jgi:hypothetical protein